MDPEGAVSARLEEIGRLVEELREELELRERRVRDELAEHRALLAGEIGAGVREREERERIGGALERIEEWTEAIAHSERRVLAAEERIRAVHRRAVEAAVAADRTGELEQRIRDAARAEEEAAARIREAERRLLEQTATDPLGD